MFRSSAAQPRVNPNSAIAERTVARFWAIWYCQTSCPAQLAEPGKLIVSQIVVKIIMDEIQEREVSDV